MPPFENLANGAFNIIKRSLGLKDGEATYFPKAGGSINIRGVFDDQAIEVDPDTEKVISSNVFTFGIQLRDLPAEPEKGDRIKIKETMYRVNDSQEDGVPGVSAVLVLHKVKVNIP